MILIEPAVIGVLGSLPDDDPVSKEAQGIRAAMKDAFASGDAERIVRTYAAHVAPGEFEKASQELEATHWLRRPYAQAFNEAVVTFLQGHAK